VYSATDILYTQQYINIDYLIYFTFSNFYGLGLGLGLVLGLGPMLVLFCCTYNAYI